MYPTLVDLHVPQVHAQCTLMDLVFPFHTQGAYTGTFVETATVIYCLSFADQGKQTSVFRLQQQTEVVVHRYSFFCIYIY
jgi:hypothetical protein